MDKHCIALTSQFIGGGPARVIRDAQSSSWRARVGSEVDQLLSANGPYAAMTVHTKYARQPAAYACRAQQPCRGLGTIAHRPAKPTDQDSVQAPTAVVKHCCRWATEFSQAEDPAQRRASRVRSDIRLGRPHGPRPVFVSGDRVWTRHRPRRGRSGQRTASAARTGPVLPRRSILGRKKIAWPGARPFSRSHIRCQACSPSSVTGTDAVVRGGVM